MLLNTGLTNQEQETLLKALLCMITISCDDNNQYFIKLNCDGCEYSLSGFSNVDKLIIKAMDSLRNQPSKDVCNKKQKEESKFIRLSQEALDIFEMNYNPIKEKISDEEFEKMIYCGNQKKLKCE